MLTSLSLIICLVMLAVLAEIVVGYGQLASLATIERAQQGDQPLVSIIVPACNEERSIEKSLRLLAALQYPNVEVIIVDDRSTDKTARIVESVVSEYPSMKLKRVRELPDGWLGKPHALQQGANASRGEFLLFIDADVCLEKSTVARAVTVMQENQLDHLSLIFQNSTGGWLLNSLIADIGAGLFFMFKPWKARDPKSRFFMGVGAFNMVRTSAYRAIGEHRNMKLQIIDDVYLGKLIKQGGFQQECMLAESLVSIPWYHTLPEMVSGLMKNVYAFFNYRISLVCLGGSVIFMMTIVPIVGALLATGLARQFFVAAVLIRLAGIGGGMVRIGLPFYSVLFLLVTPFISLFIIIRAAWMVHRDNGVSWRGSFYDLDSLKKAEWVLSGMFWRRVKRK